MQGAVRTMPDRDELIRDNIGLARSCTSRYTGRGIEYDDLFQTACLGLIKAVDAFDEARGVRFSTYAVPVILGEIRQLFRKEGTVKVSRGLKELGMKAAAANERFLAENGRAPSVGELALQLGVAAEELTLAMCAAKRPVSLTAEQDGEDDGRQLDVIEEPFDEKVVELAALRSVLCKLSEEDRRLLHERYARHRTQSVTAGLLGMTQVQVSRRESKIIRELKRLLDA